MANLITKRKRVFPVLRAPDGSAFERCHGCGVLVAIALFDMHECGDKRRVKRFKGVGVGVGGGRPPKPVPKAISGLKQSSDDETKVDVKRFKGVSVKSVALKQREFCIADQPRSPFRFFMEWYEKLCKDENPIDVDRSGFEIWKTMADREKEPYAIQAQMVNSAYERALPDEFDEFVEVDIEEHSTKFKRIKKVCYINLEDD